MVATRLKNARDHRVKREHEGGGRRGNCRRRTDRVMRFVAGPRGTPPSRQWKQGRRA
jgi:hypothetical protein